MDKVVFCVQKIFTPRFCIVPEGEFDVLASYQCCKAQMKGAIKPKPPASNMLSFELDIFPTVLPCHASLSVREIKRSKPFSHKLFHVARR